MVYRKVTREAERSAHQVTLALPATLILVLDDEQR